MKPWTREDTKCWIESLEDRLEDITFYLNRTGQWCESNDIENERTIFVCYFLTCIWVSRLRGEPISYLELMEMLGIKDFDNIEEKFYELGDEYLHLDHEELLKKVVDSIDDDFDY
jgi:hypothetical protein